MSRNFLLLVFFINQFPPSPQSIPLRPFRIFRKFAKILRVKIHHRSTTPSANFAASFASVVDTSGKFATGVNNTCGKFATGVSNAGGKLPPVSKAPAVNLP
jgi:hypothetical protein